MQENIIYCSDSCPFCQNAYRLLDKKGIPYKKIHANNKVHVWAEIKAKTGRETVPQIFINGTHIGGFDDLSAADYSGKLDALLTQ